MILDLINPYTLKIIISCRKEDSINQISNRINLSYGWTYEWVQKLADSGVFKLTRMKVYLNKNNYFYKKTLKYIKEVLSDKASFYYEILSLFGIKYAFTKLDSVFIWTEGGYNISRYKDFYPIYIKVDKKDKPVFDYYCKKLNLRVNKNKGVFYKVSYLKGFEVDYLDKIPVDSLKATISFMNKNKYNFEPALEMIKEIYNKKINIKYKEVLTNV
ncbi:MAG: hypothetical protein AABW56_04870 [Nanoarchaeota archaeon]